MGLVMSKQKMWFRKASLLASPLMTLLLSSFLVAIAAPAETAELKVAVIDSMKIIEGTNAGKKMNESLKDYIAARQKIVEGAVGMVQQALQRLRENDIVDLDEERKAQMVANLLVVLCGDRAAQPIVNAGTLY